MLIKRFAESANKPFEDREYWYDLADGTRVKCDESTIDRFWWSWVVNNRGRETKNTKRADTKEYTIFEFIEPQDLTNAKSLTLAYDDYES